jgi:methionyl-tRNA formyltransferase
VSRSFTTFRKWHRSRGILYLVLHKLGRGGPLLGWPLLKRLRDAEHAIFAECHNTFAREIAPRVRLVTDVNSPIFVEEIRRQAADAVICSGGPIYRTPLISAAKLMLNYHTGISPIYNGTDTDIWAYVNGHRQFCGGTLMLMNEAVDGGDILAHHFCGVEPGDDPAEIFCKAIKEAPQVYNEFLDDVEQGNSFVSVRQTKPFFYYRSLDWTLYQSLLAQRLRTAKTVSKWHTEADTVRYWRSDSAETAMRRLKEEVLKRVLVDA